MAHPIPVTQARIYADFLTGMSARKTNGYALSWIPETLLDHYAEAALTQSGGVPTHQDRISRVTRLNENDGKIDLDSSESSDAIELLELWNRPEIQRPSEIPVVMNVLGLAH